MYIIWSLNKGGSPIRTGLVVMGWWCNVSITGISQRRMVRLVQAVEQEESRKLLSRKASQNGRHIEPRGR